MNNDFGEINKNCPDMDSIFNAVIKYSPKDLSGLKIFCDVETSNSCPITGGPIVVVLWVLDLSLNVIDKFKCNVKPPLLSKKSWSVEAEAIHGITYNEVMGYMNNKQFCILLLNFLKKYKNENNWPIEFICHAGTNKFYGKDGNLAMPWIDMVFLEWAFKKEGLEYSLYKVINFKNRTSTVEMARKMGFKNNRLSEWITRLGLKLNNHNAEDDVIACIELYKYLINYNGNINGFKSKKTKSRPKRNENNFSLFV